MRQFKMQVSTQIDNQSWEEKCWNQWKVNSEKNGLEISKPNILCKIAFWSKQDWLNKELIIWGGLAR